MLLELMSDGTLAELPPESLNLNIPEKFENPSVVLLLPHNKYLLGQGSEWVVLNDSQSQNISLYDNQSISLLNEGFEPTMLNAETVNELRQKSLSQTEPPGNHRGAVRMLRSFMRNHEIFMTEEYLDERKFREFLSNDEILNKAYWALRFSMSRGDLDSVSRIKAWVKAASAFSQENNEMKLWFSILQTPDEEMFRDFENLGFSRLEIQRMSNQSASPIVVYNPASGWLVWGRFGRQRETVFFLWAYYNHELWDELRERRKLSISDIIHASWGEYDTREAMLERAKYKGDE